MWSRIVTHNFLNIAIAKVYEMEAKSWYSSDIINLRKRCKIQKNHNASFKLIKSGFNATYF